MAETFRRTRCNTLLAGGATMLALLAITPIRSLGAPGDVDLSFDPGCRINGLVDAICVLGDGKVLIGGYFTTVAGAMRAGLARLNPDGSTDLTFMNGQARDSGGASLTQWLCSRTAESSSPAPSHPSMVSRGRALPG